MEKEELMKILQIVMEAKEKVGRSVKQAVIVQGDEDPIVVDNTQSNDELPN